MISSHHPLLIDREKALKAIADRRDLVLDVLAQMGAHALAIETAKNAFHSAECALKGVDTIRGFVPVVEAAR